MKREFDNSAAAFASQRKEFYEKMTEFCEQGIELMKTLDVLAVLVMIVVLTLFIEHIVGWF